ncbi:hypothetical protein CANARDRAFT_175345 [[Candida] arabinofermentans NRRL YB-2248]|uniref:Scaffold protein Nfu/NifU N-terminal domain-containing protein n=1 Tax=[Candida] arabinofermentans NRRL YB-2248 TaxID=983967 RepID=A0A1E4T3W7_9ASCO|nr:hypothetical protein CANARDRAFT_175345 [[Candida] arabinofermentans NRRL YB-2248]
MFSKRLITSSLNLISQLQKRFITLEAVTTPNVNALKFLAKDYEFLPASLTNAVEIEDLPDANYKSQLAQELLKLNGVMSMMIGPNFITVTKVESSLSNNPELEWPVLSDKIVNVITNSVDSKIPILTPEYKAEIVKRLEEPQDDDDDITFEIKELINTRIRPALQDDGGDIHFRSFDENTGVVYIKLQGACKSCSLSEDTLKSGIEGMLKHYIEEVTEVRAVLDPEEEIALQEFEKLERKLKQQRA